MINKTQQVCHGPGTCLLLQPTITSKTSRVSAHLLVSSITRRGLFWKEKGCCFINTDWTGETGDWSWAWSVLSENTNDSWHRSLRIGFCISQTSDRWGDLTDGHHMLYLFLSTVSIHEADRSLAQLKHRPHPSVYAVVREDTYSPAIFTLSSVCSGRGSH